MRALCGAPRSVEDVSTENKNTPIIAITRFKARPEDTEAVKDKYDALVTTVRSADRGPAEERLGRTEDGTWVAVWLWDSAETLKKAQELAHTLPQARDAFALVADVTSEIVQLDAS